MAGSNFVGRRLMFRRRCPPVGVSLARTLLNYDSSKKITVTGPLAGAELASSAH